MDAAIQGLAGNLPCSWTVEEQGRPCRQLHRRDDGKRLLSCLSFDMRATSRDITNCKLHMLKHADELHGALLRFCFRDMGPPTSGPGLSFVFARSKVQGRERNEEQIRSQGSRSSNFRNGRWSSRGACRELKEKSASTCKHRFHLRRRPKGLHASRTSRLSSRA